MSDLSMKKIITVATTGAWPKTSNNPNLPVKPEDIAEEIYNCWKEGAAICHIHVRDENEGDTMDPLVFKKVVDTLHGNHPDCDIIINLTAAGGMGNSPESRMAGFKLLRPEMASFDCGSMNWMHFSLFDNNPKFLMDLATQMNEYGVKPEVEVFDVGMIWEAKWLIDNGYLKEPVHFQFCMGAAGGIPATVENVLVLKRALDQAIPNATWSAFGTGKGASEVLYTAIALGGNVRVGMEDNVYIKKGVLAESNMQFVARARRAIEDFGYEVATPDEARQILGLKK